MRLAAVLIAMAVFCGVTLAEEQKIAVVDMSRLLKIHPETEKAEALLEKQVEEIEAEKEQMMKKLEGMKDDLEALSRKAQNRALSEDAREMARSLLEEKYKGLRKADMDAKKTLDSRKKELSERKLMMHKRIVDSISETVGEYAEKKGYTFVLDASGIGMNGMPAIIYSTEKTDITEDIEKMLKK